MTRYRLQIALVFIAPVALLVALYALGDALGVRAPLLGRGYVVRVAPGWKILTRTFDWRVSAA